jgi:hypothetical protein|uniref:Uncharacterized protein n=1 Tax=viral metagenome TaxID=1070528 RepID=A0A6C0M193_9ZZZZ
MDSDLYATTIAAMARMINYMDASTCDAQMNLQDKESRYNIDQVYDQCCKAQKITHEDCKQFHMNFNALERVLITDDDGDFITIYNNLMKCFRRISRCKCVHSATTALHLE